MNTVRILICATFALLIAALVHTYSTRNDPERKSLAELKAELERVRMENRHKRQRTAGAPVAYGQYENSYSAPAIPAVATNTPAPPADFVNPLAPAQPTTGAEQAPSEAEMARIEALEVENAKLKEQQVQQDEETSLLNEEVNALQEDFIGAEEPDEARAEEIAQALLMATVKIYNVEHGIIVLDLVRPQNLSDGQVLGIRRAPGGIIGRVKISNLDGSAIGYADPIAESFFKGPIDIKVGDELIVIP